MRPDLDILREMLVEAEEQACAFDALAHRAWAIDEDERAEGHIAESAKHQARARVLTEEIARREPTGQVVGPATDAPPDRTIPPAEMRRRLRLVPAGKAS